VTDAVDLPIHLTPLTDAHRDLGARLIEFGGWLMPVQYNSIIEEHRTVRERVGLFDLSHMGELYVEGPESDAALNAALVSEPASLAAWRAQYSMICAPDGGVIDDLIVYRLGETRFLVVANASNAAVVSDALAERLDGFRAVLDDRSLATGLLAVQGPRSVEVMTPLTDVDLGALRYYAATEGTVAGIPALIARTGYTGEDGFEVFVDTAHTQALWDDLLDAVRGAGGGPIGLGARDTLRLEARLSLYGNDIDETTNPIEAGLGWVTKLQKASDFLGKKALTDIKAKPLPRKLVGFEMTGKGIARHGYPLLDGNGKAVGICTSGSPCPTIGKSVGLGYLPTAMTEVGTKFLVDCRGKNIDAVVVATPFYKRAK